MYDLPSRTVRRVRYRATDCMYEYIARTVDSARCGGRPRGSPSACLGPSVHDRPIAGTRSAAARAGCHVALPAGQSHAYVPHVVSLAGLTNVQAHPAAAPPNPTLPAQAQQRRAPVRSTSLTAQHGLHSTARPSQHQRDSTHLVQHGPARRSHRDLGFTSAGPRPTCDPRSHSHPSRLVGLGRRPTFTFTASASCRPRQATA